MYRPCRPAIAWPPTRRIAERRARRTAVFRPFIKAPHSRSYFGDSHLNSSYSGLGGRYGLRVEDKRAVGGDVGDDGFAFAEVAVDEAERQRILDQALDGAAHRARAELRV